MTARFEMSKTSFEGLITLRRLPIADNRGFFQRMFDLDELAQAGWCAAVKQINHTKTLRKGSLRGMHMQLPPYTEYKLVTCLHGSVFDVVVDLRAGSSTFLQTFSINLASAENAAILIPPGFAHGFQTLENDVEMLYVHSESFHSQADFVTQALDPLLKIDWPLPVAERSERDQKAATLDQSFKGFTL